VPLAPSASAHPRAGRRRNQPPRQADYTVLVLNAFGNVVLKPDKLAELAGKAQAGEARRKMHGLGRQQPWADMGS
jgi:hypothetical protein